jgi:hypothetical protein
MDHSRDFSERVDVNKLISIAYERGENLTEAQIQRLREIMARNLSEFTPDITRMGGGGMAINGFSFVGYMAEQVFGRFSEFLAIFSSGGDFGEKLSAFFNSTTSTAGASTEWRSLQEATMRIHRDLTAEGGSLANLAPIYTGQSNNGPAIDHPNSIYRQILAGITNPDGSNNPYLPANDGKLNQNPAYRDTSFQAANGTNVPAPGITPAGAPNISNGPILS